MSLIIYHLHQRRSKYKYLVINNLSSLLYRILCSISVSCSLPSVSVSRDLTIKIDNKMRFVARLFCVVFTITVIDMLIEGGYKYQNTGSVYYVSASSNPGKFYFAVVWQSLIVCVSFYFGFVVKLKEATKEDNNNKP